MSTRVEETVFISFVCPACHQELEAPADLASQTAECPACAESVHLSPAQSHVLWSTSYPPSGDDSKKLADAMKSRTIRIELPGCW